MFGIMKVVLLNLALLTEKDCFDFYVPMDFSSSWRKGVVVEFLSPWLGDLWKMRKKEIAEQKDLCILFKGFPIVTYSSS